MTTKYNDFSFRIIDARLFFLTTIHQNIQLHLHKANTTISPEEVLPFLSIFTDKWAQIQSIHQQWRKYRILNKQWISILKALELFFRETVLDLMGKRNQPLKVLMDSLCLLSPDNKDVNAGVLGARVNRKYEMG